MLISLRVLRGNGPLRSRVNPSSMSLVQPQPRKRPATRPRSTAIHRWPSSVELATTHWPWYADGINPPKQTEDEGNAARPSDGGESGTTDSIPTGIDALFTEGWWVSGNLENRSFISAIIIENCDASAWSSGILFFSKQATWRISPSLTSLKDAIWRDNWNQSFNSPIKSTTPSEKTHSIN